jgi:linoleoyl-CoA desaturase
MCLTAKPWPHIFVSCEPWVIIQNLNLFPLRDRHTYIEADSKLLKAIHKAVNAELVVDPPKFRLLIITKLLFYLSLSCITYVALYRIGDPLLFIVCFIGYGFAVLLFAFNFAHDFSHGTIFKRPTWNDGGFIFIYALNGAHAEAWKKRHIESHHFAPNVEHYDSDLEISNLIRVIPRSSYHWLHRFQHLYAPLAYTTYSLYWVLVKDFYIFFNTDQKSVRYVASFIIQKVFYFLYLFVLPVVFSLQPWYLILAGFLAMHLCQSLFLLFTFFMTHHVEGIEYPAIDESGYIKTSWVMNQIKSSNDMHPFSQTANFIFGGFNNHIAHHLFPHIHHIHYPELNKILYKVLHAHGIVPNQTTYWGGICSHLKLLKRMSEPPEMSSPRLC